MKKTWKLGEVCRGGIITVETKGQSVAIIGKEWDYSKGTMRGSNQSNAKEWIRLEVSANDREFSRKASNFLYDLTTSYHTDKIMEWINSNVNTDTMFW
jgi:hypothetical protein